MNTFKHTMPDGTVIWAAQADGADGADSAGSLPREGLQEPRPVSLISLSLLI